MFLLLLLDQISNYSCMQERGLQLNEKFDFDEEARYSSVRPVTGLDDSGFDEEEDALLDTCNDLTFGGLSTSDGQKPVSSGKGCEELWVWLSSSLIVVYS